jgi:hypothetical protein
VQQDGAHGGLDLRRDDQHLPLPGPHGGERLQDAGQQRGHRHAQLRVEPAVASHDTVDVRTRVDGRHRRLQRDADQRPQLGVGRPGTAALGGERRAQRDPDACRAVHEREVEIEPDDGPRGWRHGSERTAPGDAMFFR